MTKRMLLAVGGYTADDAAGGDRPLGLTTWWWDGTSTQIEPAGSADLPSPSFVGWHPTLPVLYAVSELTDGTLTALSVGDDGTLRVLDQAPTGGSHPCWVTVDPTGSVLLIANYASGSMAALALDDEGRPAGDPVVVQHEGSGPVPDRQNGPHVHQVVPTADGNVLASDLGADAISEYRVDRGPAGETSVALVGTIDMPAGSGTRHMALTVDGAMGFATGELDGSVTVILRDTDRSRQAEGARHASSSSQDQPSGHGYLPTDTAGWVAGQQVPASGHHGAQPSQLLLTGGDRWLLVANRGPDTVAVLEVANGLAIRQEVSVSAGPRYFVLVGDRVLVACQQGDAVDLLALDQDAGAVTRVGSLQSAIDTGGVESSSTGAASSFRTPSCVAVRPGRH